MFVVHTVLGKLNT